MFVFPDWMTAEQIAEEERRAAGPMKYIDWDKPFAEAITLPPDFGVFTRLIKPLPCPPAVKWDRRLEAGEEPEDRLP